MRNIAEIVLNGFVPPNSPPTYHLLNIRKRRQVTARHEKTITLNPRAAAGT